MNQKQKIAQMSKQIKQLTTLLSGNTNLKVAVKTAKHEDFKAKNYAKALKFYAKREIVPIETGLKVKLPTKAGIKEYEAVKFNNGKIGVVLNSGYIKYSWE